ncbi:MAG: translocation/assembly module TamB domain-containing protein [Pseudomonadota bacterium]
MLLSLCVGASSALVVWLAGTESGLRFVAGRLAERGWLESGVVSGRLIDRVAVVGARVRVASLTLDAEQAELRWRPLALLHGEWHVLSLTVRGLRVELAPSAPKQTASAPFEDLVVPLDITLEQLSFEDVALRDAAGERLLLRRLDASAALCGSAVELRRFELDTPWGMARVKGRLGLRSEDALDLGVHWRLVGDHLPATLGGSLEGEGRVSGSLRDLRFEQSVQMPFAARLSARIRPLDERLPWQAALYAERVDAGVWAPAPAAPGLWDLRMEAHGDRLGADLETVELKQDATRLSAEGRVEWSGPPHWRLTVRAEAFKPERLHPAWPGHLDALVRTEGEWLPRGARLQFDLEALRGQLRGHALEAGARGRLEDGTLDLERFALHSGGSEVEVHGLVGEALDLSLRLKSPDLAELLPGAGGVLRAHAELRGARQSPKLRAEAEGAQLRWQNLTVDELRLKAEGEPRGETVPQVELALRGVRRDGRGVLDTARVTLSGRAEAHALEASLSQGGRGMTLRLAGQGDWDGVRERLRLTEGRLDGTPFGDWRATELGEVQAEVDRFELGAWCWGQDMTRLCFGGQWRRAGAVTARFDLGGFGLGRLKPWLPDRSVRLEGELDGHVVLDAPADGPARVDARLDGRAVRLHVAGAQRDQWRSISLTQAYAEARLGGGEGVLAAELSMDPSNRLATRLALPGLRLERGVGSAQSLDGVLEVFFKDAALMAAFMPMLKDPRARLAGRIDIDGTLAAPRLTGGAQILEAHALLPELGARMEDGNLLVRAGPGHRLTLEGSARLGEGLLHIDGDADLSNLPDWRARIGARGENLSVLRLPEASVQASPDLTVTLGPHERLIEGRVEIPEALFDLGEAGGPVGARLSGDVRLLGAPPTERTPTMHTRIQVVLGERVRVRGKGFDGRIGGHLTITDRPGLPAPTGQGELTIPEGRYRAYGQDLLIERGRLLYADTPLADPALDIRAVRRVTQDNVVAGVLVGGRASRPSVRLFSEPAMEQAEALSYLITGKSLKRSGGGDAQLMMQAIQAAGYANSDVLAGRIGDAFGLDEATVETDAGTREISLVLGRYLTPRLYLRYVQGLEEGLQTFILRYELTRAIHVQVQSGVKAGADVFYSFER